MPHVRQGPRVLGAPATIHHGAATSRGAPSSSMSSLSEVVCTEPSSDVPSKEVARDTIGGEGGQAGRSSRRTPREAPSDGLWLEGKSMMYAWTFPASDKAAKRRMHRRREEEVLPFEAAPTTTAESISITARCEWYRLDRRSHFNHNTNACDSRVFI